MQTLNHAGIFPRDATSASTEDGGHGFRKEKSAKGSKRPPTSPFYDKIESTAASRAQDVEEGRIAECAEKIDSYAAALTEGLSNLSVSSTPGISDVFHRSRSTDRRRKLQENFRELLRQHQERSATGENAGKRGEPQVAPLEVNVDGFDEGELDDFLKTVYDFTEEQLASDLSVFKDAHELTYEHCRARNYGDQTTAAAGGVSSFSSSRDVFDAIGVPDGSDGPKPDEEDGGLPDPNTIGGDERLELFRRLLDEFDWERQDNQVDFHEMMIKTALPCIFKDEWDSDYDRILRMFDLYQHCAETFIVCPRRFGKTVAVAMFCAVYMYVIPKASIAIFSTAQRTSGKMMLAIYEFMRELPYFKEAVFNVKNSETINITLNGVERTMWCYPGKVGVRFGFDIF